VAIKYDSISWFQVWYGLFSSVEKNCAGIILPFVEYDLLNWSLGNMTHKETES